MSGTNAILARHPIVKANVERSNGNRTPYNQVPLSAPKLRRELVVDDLVVRATKKLKTKGLIHDVPIPTGGEPLFALSRPDLPFSVPDEPTIPLDVKHITNTLLNITRSSPQRQSTMMKPPPPGDKKSKKKPKAFVDALHDRWKINPDLTIGDINNVYRSDPQTFGNMGLRRIFKSIYVYLVNGLEIPVEREFADLSDMDWLAESRIPLLLKVFYKREDGKHDVWYFSSCGKGQILSDIDHNPAGFDHNGRNRKFLLKTGAFSETTIREFVYRNTNPSHPLQIEFYELNKTCLYTTGGPRINDNNELVYPEDLLHLSSLPHMLKRANSFCKPYLDIFTNLPPDVQLKYSLRTNN